MKHNYLPIKKGWTPEHWANLIPFGLTEQAPNNYMELLRALRDTQGEWAYAWRILTEGVCDGCALGTSGIRDWTIEGVHLCNIRLRLLKLNTMPALDINVLNNAKDLQALRGEALRDMGRLPYPMLRNPGEDGFQRISWDEALDLVANTIQESQPERTGYFLTSRGMPNEAYYAAQKAVRAMGSNNIDNAARICHSPSTVALKQSTGAGATTCSYIDWLKADMIIFFGSNAANNQPVATKYLHYAKKQGAKIHLVNAYHEPGMERYWIPSVPESALFGTKLADEVYLVNTGADMAFINGTLKHIFEQGWADSSFIEQHTEGADALIAQLEQLDWESLERTSGVDKDRMLDFARAIRKAEKAVFVWSMGITQHTHGVDNVQAIINLALTKGFVGRDGCGLMPIRGHSGVQGGAEMGAYSTAFPGVLPVTEEHADTLEAHWGFRPPTRPGLPTADMIDRAHEGDMDLLFSVGGNFMEVLPEPDYVREALTKIPLRVHMDIVLSSQMLEESEGQVLLLPACTRYETPGGVTQTSTERRITFSPEIEGRRIGEARPEWEVFLDLAKRVRPDLKDKLDLPTTHALRKEIAKVIPFYEGIQNLKEQGDNFQYGGTHLCADWNFETPDKKAHFIPVHLERDTPPKGMFYCSTRRGKQFNSMVQEKQDAITGALREAILMNPTDLKQLGIKHGDTITLKNELGTYTGHAHEAPVKPGNVQVHWPEGNHLLDRKKRSPKAGVPDYNCLVHIEPGRGGN